MGVDSAGNIYIVDSGNERIQKFDKNGKYIKTIGRKGQGPGEFDSPTSIFIDVEDNIYIKDGREIEIFDKNGNFIKKYLVIIPLLTFHFFLFQVFIL
jgi:sugar lactone lactonase YvrE